MKTKEQLKPTVFTIIGGGGDLTWRKLVPALFDLSHDRSITDHLAIIAVDRAELSDEKLRKRLHDGVNKFSRQGVVSDSKWDRFANPLFEPIWNRRYVEYVAITVAEELGIGHRGGYYDKAGALRDMIQNHLMQLLCLVAMEPMVSFEADEIRNYTFRPSSLARKYY